LWSGLALAAALALAEAWAGLTVAFYTDWPVSFCIALLSAAAYFAALTAPTRLRNTAIAGAAALR
jgi:zinc/manganese transport system permease protein